MKNKKNLAKIILLFIVSVFTIVLSFAWLTSMRSEDVNVKGSSLGAYFEKGDGFETTETEIAGV